MADTSILTTWGSVFPGRETMGLQIFQEAIVYFESARAKGQLADFKVGICDQGDLGKLAGYMVAEGSREQVEAVLGDEAYKRILAKAAHVVSLRTVTCVTGTGVPGSVERLQTVRKELGID